MDAAGDTVLAKFVGTGLQPAETYEFEVEVTADHPLVSVVSMIAPSPDWMAGVSGANTYDEAAGEFRQSLTVDLYAIDAGTDSGATYTAANNATAPPVGAFLIPGAPFNNLSVGTVELTRTGAAGRAVAAALVAPLAALVALVAARELF
jgi:hypothetical protein